MKKSILLFGAFCSVPLAIAQDTPVAADKATKNITMMEGVFCPNHEIQGKVYFSGT